MNYNPNQFPQDQGHNPQGFDSFDQNAFGEGQEFVTYTPRQKEPYWKRIGGGSLGLSVLIHVLFLLIAYFLIKFALPTAKEEVVDFLPGGGGGGKSTEKKMANKRKSVSMTTPRARIAANVSTSAVTLPDVQSTALNTSMSGFAMPSAGGVGGGEGGLAGRGKGGKLGDGFGKGVGPGSGIGFVGNLPAIMRSRCSPQERSEKMRQNGGNEECERAVVKALDWLKANQNPDGSWGRVWKAGMTGLALLAYYGHCETPDSPFYGETVMKGITYLTDLGGKNNGFFTERLGSSNHLVYEHGIACYAMGETYSFSKLGNRQLPNLRERFEDGVKIIVQYQQDNGNWAYGGNSPHYVESGREDMSVTGWQFQALKAAKHTNLKIAGLQTAMKKAAEYLESRSQPEGGIGHNGGKRGSAYSQWSMTGIGVLGLQTLSGGSASVANKGLRFLLDEMDKDPLDWNKNANIYCWYYNTQAFFQKGGKDWETWNAGFRDQVVKNQEADGSWKQETGDFNAATSSAAGQDADIYRTCLCTLMLEVYYRYLKVGDRGE
jgi:hypothetical protein